MDRSCHNRGMRLVRVYSAEPLAANREHTLSRSASDHVLRVLRLHAGDPLVLFDGRGGEYPARLVGAGKGGAVVATGDHHGIERESPLAITLLQGLARGEKMDLVVQKATELGIARIVPVALGRSVMRVADGERADRKLAHWQAVAVSACEQCGRNRVPEILAPMAFAAALALAADIGQRLLLAPSAEQDLGAMELTAAPLALLIGPEGGLEDDEIVTAARQGWRAARFGPRVLRTETAAIAALAVLQARAGDLGGRDQGR